MAAGAKPESAPTRQPGLIPVLIPTSSREQEDAISGYSPGADSYLRKPVDFTEFQEAVKVLGVYWLMMNEPAPGRALK